MRARHKIFFVITKGNFGGAQRYVCDLATALPESEFEVTVIFGRGNELGEKLAVKGIKTQRLEQLGRDVSFFADWRVFLRLWQRFRQSRPDIVHLNSSKAGLLGALAARLSGVPKIIFTAHAWAFNERRPWWQRLAIKLLHWLTVLLVHKTIAVSEKTKNDLVRWPGMKHKFAVIHNGLSPLEFQSRFAARQELASLIWKKELDPAALDEVLIIGTIAELHRNKGLDLLLDALGQLKGSLGQTLVWLIGDGEEKDKLRAQIKKLDLAEQVILLGPVKEAARYLKAFDIFTLTSRTEALPYALLEAGQAGLPVIASAVGGIPEVIANFNLGILVRPGNIKELKLALLRLIENKNERAKFGQNLAKQINKEFSLKKMLAQTVALYNKK